MKLFKTTKTLPNYTIIYTLMLSLSAYDIYCNQMYKNSAKFLSQSDSISYEDEL